MLPAAGESRHIGDTMSSMKAQFEKVRSSSNSFVVFERRDPSFPFVWHYHPEFELTLIVDSCGQRFIGDGVADYGPGDLVLIGPDLPHSWRSGPAGAAVPRVHRAVVIQFRRDCLGATFFALDEMAAVARMLDRAANGLAFGHTRTGKQVALAMAEMPTLPPERRLVRLLSILIDLAGEADALPVSTGQMKPICRFEDQQRIDLVCSKLHFAEEIDYGELARQVHMDLASLCRFFKRATGRTITAYVNELRVAAATKLLVETDLSILEIGFRVGFGNYSNFNRQFLKIKGLGPRDLRRQFGHPQSNGIQKLVNAREDKKSLRR